MTTEPMRTLLFAAAAWLAAAPALGAKPQGSGGWQMHQPASTGIGWIDADCPDCPDCLTPKTCP